MSFRKTILAAIYLFLGAALGIAFLEAALRLNPELLLRGMGAPAPVDPQVVGQDYEVHYSDADVFLWEPGLIRPIAPSADGLEARVHFQTDEFGFPNPIPLPAKADVVVLGRSYSMGAQASQPWPRLLEALSGLKVLNLSQVGSGIALKQHYYLAFGLTRQPRWVVIEVLPSMDIIGNQPDSPYLVQGLPFSIAQTLIRRMQGKTSVNTGTTTIYPLAVQIPGRTVQLAFFNYYLAALTVDWRSLEASSQWQSYHSQLRALAAEIRRNGACPVLLYIPTKEDLFLPIAQNPEQLEPILSGLAPWRLNTHNDLVQDPSAQAAIEDMRTNASAARTLLAELAQQQGILMVDPAQQLAQAAEQGIPPYMAYDTHWSATGHRIVANMVWETLQNKSCP